MSDAKELSNFCLKLIRKFLPPRPHAHEVSRYRAVAGKKEEYEICKITDMFLEYLLSYFHSRSVSTSFTMLIIHYFPGIFSERKYFSPSKPARNKEMEHFPSFPFSIIIFSIFQICFKTFVRLLEILNIFKVKFSTVAGNV
ncbi:hypothetical protein ASJ81_12345 [Methanosarcina spelaei]|uniref:Uncharacterized protein n=1 Tax=Methanosarcina spelaei TaxID=1036679 RepID=A0A2A2HN58_9EURY|nr:hypothetical protein ASJ81_12345 [Methanosarcina spelaei]